MEAWTLVKSGKVFVFPSPSIRKLTRVRNNAKDGSRTKRLEQQCNMIVASPGQSYLHIGDGTICSDHFSNEDFAYSPEKDFSGEELLRTGMGLSPMIFSNLNQSGRRKRICRMKMRTRTSFADKETKTYQSVCKNRILLI